MKNTMQKSLPFITKQSNNADTLITVWTQKTQIHSK